MKLSTESNTAKRRPVEELQARYSWGPNNMPIFLGNPVKWTEEDKARAKKIVEEANRWMNGQT